MCVWCTCFLSNVVTYVSDNVLSTFQVPEIGHIMSPTQLSQLWHFDMLMANVILRLPLRKCSSIPGDSNSPEMDSKSFQDLKSRIAHMWINASHLFECRKTDEHGWGLFVSDNYNKTEWVLMLM